MRFYKFYFLGIIFKIISAARRPGMAETVPESTSQF
jgi:hypothetical protein